MAKDSLQYKAKSWVARMSDPAFRPELIRRAKRKISETVNIVCKGSDHRLKDSKDWCESRAVSIEQTLEKLGVSPETLQKWERFKNERLPAAEERFKKNIYHRYIGPANLQVLYCACEQIGAKDALETGVAHGWSSLALLDSVKERGGHVVSNDLPATDGLNEDYIGLVVPDDLRSLWILMRGADREGLTQLKNKGKTFDLIHYDSDKTYDGRMFGYGVMYDHLLKPGGIFMSDDIDDNHAFADFCAQKGLQPIVIRDEEHGKYEGLVIKPAA